MLATTLAEPSSPPLPDIARMRRRLRLVWRLVVLAIVVWFGYEAGRRLVGHNFHTVLPGRVFRGAQPSSAFVEELATVHGVKTIVNLRGCGLPVDWYDRETQAVQKLGITQEDVCFSALRLPSSLELRRLVDVLDHAEYPIYLHCRRGSDRTGMASALVLLLQTDAPLAEARKQLSLRYAHISWGKTGVLDRFLDLYEAWLAKEGRPHDSKTLRHWLLEEYRGGWCRARFEEFTPLQVTAKKGEPIGYRVRVQNIGPEPWSFRASKLAGNHLAYQIWDGETPLAEGRAGLLDKDVPPGDAIDITLVVRPMQRVGRFRLIVDMVEEGHCWFYQAGSEPHEEELWIRE